MSEEKPILAERDPIMTEHQKIEMVKGKSEKELLQSICYDIDGIKGYVRVIGVVFLFQVVLSLGFGIWIGLQLAGVTK